MFFVFLKVVLKNSFYSYFLWNGNKVFIIFLEWNDYLFSFKCLVIRIGNGKIKKLTIITLCI